MLSKQPKEPLALVVVELLRQNSDSLESVLLLVPNGRGNGALTIARTMFECAVTAHYLHEKPELVVDYVDFVWVKRRRYQEYLSRFHPQLANAKDPEQLAMWTAEYERIRTRFQNRKGEVRNSWSKTTFRDMAKAVGMESMYGGLYELPSSVVHGDILGLILSESSWERLSLQMGTFAYAITLSVLDEIFQSEFDARLKETWSTFTTVSA
jgi:hypothetical protein